MEVQAVNTQLVCRQLSGGGCGKSVGLLVVVTAAMALFHVSYYITILPCFIQSFKQPLQTRKLPILSPRPNLHITDAQNTPPSLPATDAPICGCHVLLLLQHSVAAATSCSSLSSRGSMRVGTKGRNSKLEKLRRDSTAREIGASTA